MFSDAKLFNEGLSALETVKYESFSQEEFGLLVQFQYNDLYTINSL